MRVRRVAGAISCCTVRGSSVIIVTCVVVAVWASSSLASGDFGVWQVSSTYYAVAVVDKMAVARLRRLKSRMIRITTRL